MSNPILVKKIRKFNNLLELETTTNVKILVNLDQILSVVPTSRNTCKIILEGWDVELVESYNTIVKCLGPYTEIDIYKEDV